MAPPSSPATQIANLQATIEDLLAQRAALVAAFPVSNPTNNANASASTAAPHLPDPATTSPTTNNPPVHIPITSTPLHTLPTLPSIYSHSRPLLHPSTSHPMSTSNLNSNTSTFSHEIGSSIDLDAQAAPILKEANAVIQRHIKLLHEYNAVKDVAQGMMGMLAEKRGVRLVDVMEELGVEEGE